MTESVFVRGLEFEGNHGYTAAERRGTRRFRVNLSARASARGRGGVGPDRRHRRLLEGQRDRRRARHEVDVRLLEALAGAIAAKIQELYPSAAVAIELEKLAPPCPGVPAACGVTLYLPAP